jgi:hypothetical protein
MLKDTEEENSNDILPFVVAVMLIALVIGGMVYGIYKIVDWTGKDRMIFLGCMNDTANNDCNKNDGSLDYIDWTWDRNYKIYYYECRGDTTRYNFTNIEEELCR